MDTHPPGRPQPGNVHKKAQPSGSSAALPPCVEQEQTESHGAGNVRD